MDISRTSTGTRWVVGVVAAVGIALGTVMAHRIAERVGERSGQRVSESSGVCEFDCLSQKNGVFFSTSFETDAEVNDYRTSPLGCVTLPIRSTAEAASGNSSMEFRYVAFTGQTGACDWRINWTEAPFNGPQIMEGDTLYLYFKYKVNTRYSQTGFDGNNGAGAKIFIIHQESTGTCHEMEQTLIWRGDACNSNCRPIYVLYSHCGDYDIRYTSPEIVYQHGWHDCHFSTGLNTPVNDQLRPSCANMYEAPEVWQTFYTELDITTWDMPTSSWFAWLAVEGYQNNQFLKWSDRDGDYTFRDGNASRFDSLYLAPYMNNKSSSQDHVDAVLWYDDVILSTEPLFTCSEVTKTCDGPGY